MEHGVEYFEFRNFKFESGFLLYALCSMLYAQNRNNE